MVLRQRFRTQRCGVCPIETRGALAIWSETDGLTVHLTTQRPHIERLALADLLELSTAEVRVHRARANQGGGFGVKAPFYREHVVVCHLARKLGRPVRWIETREEHLMTVSQERDQIHDLELAADKEGRILALRNRGIGDVGDGRQGVYWGFVMPSLGSVMLPSAYAIGHADIKLRCAVTNKTCISPSRSFGALPTRFALERALDMLARRLGMETAELKRRNLIADFPFHQRDRGPSRQRRLREGVGYAGRERRSRRLPRAAEGGPRRRSLYRDRSSPAAPSSPAFRRTCWCR